MIPDNMSLRVGKVRRSQPGTLTKGVQRSTGWLRQLPLLGRSSAMDGETVAGTRLERLLSHSDMRLSADARALTRTPPPM